jgi:hypothetical protein
MEYVDEHPEMPWDWDILSRNPNFMVEYVEKHPEKLWNLLGLSRTPNLTMKFVERHPKMPWSWFDLSSNPFNGELPRLRKYATSVATIEAWWVDVRSNPRWKRARERLRVELEGLRNE